MWANWDALKAIDPDLLKELIDKCMDEKRTSSLRALRLDTCGPFVSTKLREFDQALVEYDKAKSAKKCAEMRDHARRAGSALANAVERAQYQVATEEADDQLFFVDDNISPPSRFGEDLTVYVSFRWRRAIEDKWEHGSITFSHRFQEQPDYTRPAPKRKPTASELAHKRQEKLFDQWSYLMRSGLQSVKEFFKQGGEPTGVPETFQARADDSGHLNNFSTSFWLARRVAPTDHPERSKG
jgi:hypothetical protein